MTSDSISEAGDTALGSGVKRNDPNTLLVSTVQRIRISVASSGTKEGIQPWLVQRR
jgi:hypothetical protein